MIMILVILVILGAVFAGIAVFVINTKNSIKKAYKDVVGDQKLADIIQDVEWVESSRPKQVASATNLYMPMIRLHFPHFNWSEYQLKAKNTIKSMLLAMSNHDLSLLPQDVNEDLKNQVILSIQDDENGGVRTIYDDITVHEVEIVNYKRHSGNCVIKMQASVGCMTWKERDGHMFEGSKVDLKQSKYSFELIYIQDSEKANQTKDTAAGVTCPNCGAPVTSLGSKKCDFCGAALEEYNSKVWRFGTLKLIG